MDQNVVRTDLLPETLSLWLIAVLAVFGVVLWSVCHWALRRYGSNKFNLWQRALLSVPFGTIACWLVLQTLARVLFLATPWSLFLSAAVGAVSLEAISAFYTHECARVAPRTAKTLVFCRMAAVSIALLVLMQPVLVGERERTVSQRVLVLVDDSASMHFKDRQLTDAERAEIASALGLKDLPQEGLTRAEMIRRLVAMGGDSSFLKRTARKFAVDVFRFGNGIRRDESYLAESGSAPAEERPLDAKEELFRSTTDITAALELALKEVPPEEIASVILFTDGRHNGEAGVESVARRLGGYGIAVSSVVVGGTVKPFDLAIASADSRESVFLGDKVRFTVSVSATHANGRKARLRFQVEEQGGFKDLEEQEVSVEGDDWIREFKFTHVPAEKGVYRYRLAVTQLEGELFADNNTRDLDVAVSDDRTNVLLVDGRPRWEYRYLRNLFYGRDKSVHLQDWLVHPDRIEGVEPKLLEFACAGRPFGDSESGGFPVDLEEWRKFDIIILGDIGEDILTETVIERIKYCVEERGALLVLISGSEYMPYGIRNQNLRDLMPIDYDPDDATHRNAPEDDYRFSLSAAGRGHTVMSQSSSSSENEDIWNEIPDFHWRLPIKGVKPGTEVLAFARGKKKESSVSASALAESIAATIEDDPETALRRLEEMRGEQNRNAVVTACARGKGRVLMMTTDSMWRLRSKQGDALHHRFWGQVMRWGAGERMRAGNNHVRIGTDQLRYGAGETVKAYVRILDEKFNGVDGAEPRLVVTPPNSGKGSVFHPVQREDGNGFYECEIHGCTEPGAYTVTLECNKARDRLGRLYPVLLQTKFVVVTTKQPAEEVDITATRTAVERIAATTGGKVLSPSEYVRLDADFGGGSKQVADRVEYQLWSLPPLFILIILLLTVEWIVRKRASLV